MSVVTRWRRHLRTAFFDDKNKRTAWKFDPCGPFCFYWRTSNRSLGRASIFAFVCRRTTRGGREDAISLSFHKEMAKEREPKGLMPFGFPQCVFAGAASSAARRKNRHLQLLRLQVKETCKHGSRSDVAFAKDDSYCISPCDRRKFKPDGKAKAFASATPSWACAYAPKMEEAC